MPKKMNPALEVLHLRKENAHLRYNCELMKGFTLQQSLDMVIIALHEEFGFGPDRSKKFADAFMETFMWYANMSLDDAKDDQEIEYTKAKVDRLLREACGDDILPFDERYQMENLYTLDKLKKQRTENGKANG